MNKSLAYLLIAVFGGIGAYIPVLFGSSGISGWSLIGSFIGGIVGIYVAYKMSFD